MKPIGRLVLLVGTLGLVLVVALSSACGGGGGEPEARDAMNGHGESGASGEGAIHISLTEWEITGEDGAPVPAAQAGEVTFEVHNEGEVSHEFAIIKADTDSADLPVSGTAVDEEAAGELIGRVDQFAGGGEIEVHTFELEAGTYALICNIAGHYEQGMQAQLVVE